MDSTLRLDSSIVSRHRIYSLSVPSGALPLFSRTECHLITLTPEVHILLYQTLGLTLYSCLYFRSTLQLLRYAAFLQDFVIMNFQFFRWTLVLYSIMTLPTSSYSSTPPLRLWYVCVLFVLLCMLVHGCPFGRVWEGPAFVILSHSPHQHRLFDSSTQRLIDSSNSLCLCVPFLLWEFFVSHL